MVEVIDLPAIQTFSIGKDKWKKSLDVDYYIRASGITDQKQKQKHVILRHLAGPDVQDIFETLANAGEKMALKR